MGIEDSNKTFSVTSQKFSCGILLPEDIDEMMTVTSEGTFSGQTLPRTGHMSESQPFHFGIKVPASVPSGAFESTIYFLGKNHSLPW